MTPVLLIIPTVYPSGLECAVTLAQRGHKVTLLEKAERIGGQLIPASAPAYKKEEFDSIIDYYETMLKKHGVEVRLSSEVRDAGDVKDAEAVMVATGALPAELPCAGKEHVANAFDVLNGVAGKGVKDVVVIGGSGVGIDIAIKLTENQGVKVTIIEMTPAIGGDLNEFLKRHTKAIMAGRNITAMTNAEVISAAKGSVTVRTLFGEKKIPCDLAVSAVGFKPNLDEGLVEKLREAGREVFVLPSSEDPKRIFEATQAGYWTALEV